MRKKVIAILLSCAMVLEGIGMVSGAVQAEEMQAEEVQMGTENTSIETAEELVLNEAKEVTIGEGEEVYYCFTPDEDGYYKFFSENEEGYDPKAELLDAEENVLAENDDRVEDNNFSFTYPLEAGKTYYLKASIYNGGNGTINIYVEQVNWYVEDTDRDVTITYGESFSLETVVIGEETGLSYEWYAWRDAGWCPIEGATDNSYTVDTSVMTEMIYYCRITDGDETVVVYYYITLDTGLELEETSVTQDIIYGESTTLTVSASGGMGTLRYEWGYWDQEGNYVIIEDATGNSCEVTADKALEYQCAVTDGIQTETCDFCLKVDTGLRVEVKQSEVIVIDGEKATLSVIVEGGVGPLSYQWYYYDESEDEYVYIEGATEADYVITGDAEIYSQYYCEVTDGIMQVQKYVEVSVLSAQEFEDVEEMEFSDADFTNDDRIAYRMTPQQDVNYHFYSTGNCDPYVILLDGQGNKLASADDDFTEDNNFSL